MSDTDCREFSIGRPALDPFTGGDMPSGEDIAGEIPTETIYRYISGQLASAVARGDREMAQRFLDCRYKIFSR